MTARRPQAEIRADAKRWAEAKPLLEKLVRARPASARSTTLGALAQILGIVDEIQDFINSDQRTETPS